MRKRIGTPWQGRPSRLCVLFFPEQPDKRTAPYRICDLLSHEIVIDPRQGYDVAIKWRDETLSDQTVLSAVPTANENIINSGSLDISKRTLDREFKKVFGYQLSVDPLIYTGDMVEKSNKNATHDGRIISGPIPREKVRADAVYQKLINTNF